LGSGGSITTQDNNFATKAANAEVFALTAVDANSSIVGAIIFKKASSSTTNISFYNSGTEGAFYIAGSGNIGIGKTTPGAKLDVSGSAIISGSLTVTAGIIGSLQGTAATASYFSGSISNAINATSASFAVSASQAVSSSFASTASFTPNAIVTASVSLNTITFTKGNGTTFPITVNTGSGGGGGGGAAFPYTGSATILGSLVVSENIIGGTITSLDTNNRTLQDTLGRSSIDWSQRQLYNPSGSTTAIDWSNFNHLSSNVYQRDFKSASTQNNLSATVGHPGRSYMGDVIEVDGVGTIIDASVTNGMLVGLYTNIWYPVDQSDPNIATCLLGIAHNVGIGTGWVFLEGHVVIDDTSTAGPYVANAGYGLPVYIEDSTTTGTMSTTVPTTTGGPNIVRVLGHCYQQNTTTATQWMMKFRPSNDWVEI
jgi:hypothetical protein